MPHTAHALHPDKVHHNEHSVSAMIFKDQAELTEVRQGKVWLGSVESISLGGTNSKLTLQAIVTA